MHPIFASELEERNEVAMEPFADVRSSPTCCSRSCLARVGS
jgi:hypothetical protein